MGLAFGFLAAAGIIILAAILYVICTDFSKNNKDIPKIGDYKFVVRERNKLILEVEKYHEWEKILHEKGKAREQERKEQELWNEELSFNLLPEKMLIESKNGWMLYHCLRGIDVHKPDIMEIKIHNICEKVATFLSEEELELIFNMDKKNREWMDEIYKTIHNDDSK